MSNYFHKNIDIAITLSKLRTSENYTKIALELQL